MTPDADDAPDDAPDDALEHLWSAAHEFLRAMRALVDAADSFVEQQRQPHEAHAPRVHRIDVE